LSRSDSCGATDIAAYHATPQPDTNAAIQANANMALDNKLGPHTFLGLTGDISPPKEVVSADERPAVNGTELTKEGQKGRPFVMVSWVDAESYDAARADALEYRDLIGAEPVEMVVGGVSSNLEGYKVAVLDVQAKASALAASKGGLNAPSLGLVEAQWTLIAIANP
jgi:hypothetical protein